MGQDYYKILGVDRSANDSEIKKAYRKLAMKHHPDKGGDSEQFKKISEAYEVLSDPEKKKVYDQFGEEGLKGGAGAAPGGAGPSGGTFHFNFRPSNPEDIFRSFFGGSSMFDDEGFFSTGSRRSRARSGGAPSGFASMFGGMPGGGGFPGATFSTGDMDGRPSGGKKQEPIKHKLQLSLEDLYTGCTKKMKVTKKVMDGASGKLVQVQKVLEIPVKPGWKAGTKVTFEKEGDELPGVIPADIIFEIEEKPHDRFRRDGKDLHYTSKIDLNTAYTGGKVNVRHLDGRNVTATFGKLKSSGETVTIIGEGMPSKTGKGDLVVHFDVLFPPR